MDMITMTKLLKPLGMDLYIFVYSAHKGNIRTVGIGTVYQGEIEDHTTAAEILNLEA